MGAAAGDAAAGKHPRRPSEQGGVCTSEQVAAPGKRRARQWPKRLLLACFFVLGMGLMVSYSANQQASDYFIPLYRGMHANRVVNTCYYAGFMVMLFVLFFGGPNILPNKRARMCYGYMTLLASLVLPTLIDGLIGELAEDVPAHSLRASLAPWAVAGFVGGAAEATVASVLNGEAAALGCNKAASFGKPAGGLFIVLLRVAVKAALPAAGHDLYRLRIGVSIHLTVAAAMLLLCVLLTAFAIPSLVDLVQQTESADVPPGLSFEQTLNTAYTAMEGGPQGEAAAAALQAACSLAPLQPTGASTFGLPLLEIRREPTQSGFSLRLSAAQNSFVVNSPSVLLPTAGSHLPTVHSGLNADMRGQSILRQYMAEHAGTFTDRRRRTTDCTGSSLAGTSRCTTPVTLSPLSTPPAGASPTAAHWHQARHARSSGMRRQLSSVLGGRAGRTSSMGGRKTPPGSHLASPRLASPLGTHSGHDPSQAASQGGTCKALEAAPHHKVVPHPLDTASSVQDHGSHQLKPSAGGQLGLSQAPGKASGGGSCAAAAAAGADTVALSARASERSLSPTSPSPFHSQQMSTHFDPLEEGAVKISLLEVLGACWKVARGIAVIMGAVLIIPIVGEQNKSMAWGSTRNGVYYPQLVELAKLTGSMLGSQLLPVYHPSRPKPMLLAMFAAMLLLLAPSALARQFGGDTATVLAVLFCSYTFGGHLNSTAYSLAKQTDMPADDSRMAQLLLALTAAVGSWLSYCLSWLWVAVPPV